MTRLNILLLVMIIFIPKHEVFGFELDPEFNRTLEYILKETHPDNIASILRNLTSRPHVGGTEAEWETARYVADTWRSQGMDDVHLVPYEVLLSYPEMEKPNYVILHDPSGKESWRSQGRSPPLRDGEGSNEIFPDFNAFSAPGTVQGDLVFVNFGTYDDFDRMPDLGVDVSGKIVIAKYGQVFRANIARTAQDRGAIAVLLYPDPHEYAQSGPERAYPHTVSMPGSAAPFGSTYLADGDPMTPHYPSIESAFRIPEEEADLPKIPIMPLSYNDAAVILSQMGGMEAPAEWKGSLNLTYRVGPGFKEDGWNLTVEVHTHNQKTTTYNVVGMMRGKQEPDRYVILGNHRDAWIFGAIDPSSASAVMLELTRVLLEYKRTTGWQPRRTLVFCSWGAEEYGLIGSTEWTEQFGKQLADRTIAYLNMDMAMEGNYTLRTKASPLLYNIGREITKLVPNPDPKESEAGRATVYDTWAYRKPSKTRSGFPEFTGLGSGSDYKGFQHNLGIPCLEYRYTHSKEMFAEPLYHTVYETFYLVSELYDRGFEYHSAMAKLWALIATYMADAQVLPFSLDEYSSFIDEAQQSLFKEYGIIIRNQNITLDYFQNASAIFSEKVESFKMTLAKLNASDVLAVRRANDQMMMVEKAFLDPLGLPGRPFFNHVVFAPSSKDSYASTAFAGLSDALSGIETLPEVDQTPKWREFEQHLATCTHLLMTAGKVLSEELW